MALVFALLVAVPAAADTEVHCPRHRTGEDGSSRVAAVLGPEGSVAVDGHTRALVVIGSAEAIAQAMQRLAIQGRPRRRPARPCRSGASVRPSPPLAPTLGGRVGRAPAKGRQAAGLRFSSAARASARRAASSRLAPPTSW